MGRGDLQTLTLHSVVKNVLPVMIDFNFLTFTISATELLF